MRNCEHDATIIIRAMLQLNALIAVMELRDGEVDQLETRDHLRNIENYLADESLSKGMTMLNITEVELAQWREKYR